MCNGRDYVGDAYLYWFCLPGVSVGNPERVYILGKRGRESVLPNGGEGVLSAPSLLKAVQKAKKAECLFDKPERGEYCRFEEATEIREVAFRDLEGYTTNIDKHFMRDGVFRKNSNCDLRVVK